MYTCEDAHSPRPNYIYWKTKSTPRFFDKCDCNERIKEQKRDYKTNPNPYFKDKAKYAEELFHVSNVRKSSEIIKTDL
jgi:hypothetical protein